MKLSQKWLEKFGGYENEREGVNYQTPDFLVSDKCCYYLKEKPCSDYARKTGRYPYMGLMASEGGRRQKALMINGCNYISKGTKRSCPFAIFNRQDLLRLALEMEEYYHEHWQEFGARELETIVPAIYGEIVRDPDETLRTTKAQRTGCSMCGFGIHLEKRPHRFDRLWETNPKEWEMWMTHVVTLRTTKAQRTGCSMCGFGIHLEKRPHRFDRLWETNPKEWEMWMTHVVQQEDGSWHGWGHVLDYIGVEWRNPEAVVTEYSQIKLKV